ncbi:unnamed protein product [Rhizoctonia solani]|uniref:Enoyl reductase (ER) domain-containing protein n=1 Tax=Rhizoctonia solani TaxID=456999 RepID=A0A8H3GAQ3_9AGAM|nr:unnamed protein product [Rhizoctonia solani]
MSSIPTIAKAWRYPPTEPSSWNAYHILELQDVQVPAPGRGEVLVKMRAVALNNRVIIFPAEFILPIPDHLSYEESASVICAGITAYNALFEYESITPDSTVLVLGSGGISVLGAQLAKAAGARVIATTSSEEKAQKYKALGADYVINYRKVPNWAEEVKKATGGQGVDHVLEIGGKGTLVEAVRSIKVKGVVHIIGLPEDEAPATALYDLAAALVFSQGKTNGVATGGKDLAQRLDSFISKHNLKPWLDSKIFRWEEAREAYGYFQSGAHFGKVVIRID